MPKRYEKKRSPLGVGLCSDKEGKHGDKKLGKHSAWDSK
jgi:hypothetical protein